MQDQFVYSLSLFGEGPEGGQETPALTRQASGEEAIPVAGEENEETRREHFKSMMEGEYKDLFQAFFQETFNRRFKEQKGMMEELDRARNVVSAAAERYGTHDEVALCAAIRAEKEKTASAEAAPSTHPSESDIAASAAAIEAAVARAREETERAVTESIRARGLRPAENALAPGVGAGIRGAARLTRAERAEMARRAARGERIEF
ncbi:MAG: hypothetical protein E7639_03875 [Ruminococcaceae bacterium]|nr:hypothetical protein [Oscillospiraceae bacterium]